MSENVKIKVNNRLGEKTLVKESVRLAFVETAISKELCARSSGCSVAGNKYQLGLIKRLEKAFGRSVYVISVRPVAMYPRSRTIFSPQKTSRVSNLTMAILIPFFNLAGIPHLLRWG